MNQVELLRHVADNIEAGRPAGYGLMYVSGNKITQIIDFNCPQAYMLAPKTVIINGIEVERGVDVTPEIGARYYLPDTIYPDNPAESFYWDGDKEEMALLKRGLVFLDKEKAIAMAEAMLNFQQVE